ncbi:hypothetical protein P9222_11525 [Paenibacillus amylolyticus]|nr:hypothetical protein [Paenibacillus amylolyticus]WFR64665.1 hypothetical protein P9222_11525 [Paenibacillus amylolyticus]
MEENKITEQIQEQLQEQIQEPVQESAVESVEEKPKEPIIVQVGTKNYEIVQNHKRAGIQRSSVIVTVRCWSVMIILSGTGVIAS